MYKTKLKWHPQIIKISYSIFCPIPKGKGVNRKISFRLVYKTEYTHNHLFICIYRNYLSVCPPIVSFPTPHYPIPLLPPPYVFLCYYVFTYSVPPVFMSSVPLLPCLLHTLSLMSLCHSGFRSSVTLSFTYSVPYVFMSFWLHKCKVFLSSYYFVGKL